MRLKRVYSETRTEPSLRNAGEQEFNDRINRMHHFGRSGFPTCFSARMIAVSQGDTWSRPDRNQNRPNLLRNAGKQESKTELTGLLLNRLYSVFIRDSPASRSATIAVTARPARTRASRQSHLLDSLDCSSVCLVPVIRNNIVPFVGR